MFYRLGRAAARFRYLILGGWLVLVLACLPFAPRVAGILSPGGFTSSSMQSQQALDALQSRLHANFTFVQVIFTSKTLAASSPQFIQEAGSAVQNLAQSPAVTQIVPFTENPSQVSRDGHAAYTLVFFQPNGGNAQSQLAAVRSKLVTPRDLQMTVGGGPVFYADIQSVSEADLRRAETIAFPFALLALLLVFRSVVAAALPAAVGGCSVIVSLALLYAIASHSPVSIFALNITTLFGLGLGVDYSLFMVSRFREELAHGRPIDDAIGATMATAGRAVFFSGLTVSIGLLGLMIVPLNMLRSIGIGGMMTVALAILAAVTLLPALLAILGYRVNALPVRLPWRRGAHSRLVLTTGTRDDGFWHRLAMTVMRHPVRVIVPVLAILLALGSPFLSVRLAAPDASILPASVKSREAYDILAKRFDQSALSPMVVAVETNGSPLAPANLSALDTYVRQIEADPRVQSVTSIVSLDPRISLRQYELMYANPQSIGDPYITRALATYAGPDITMVQVISKYSMLDNRSEALVAALRNTTPPPGLHVLVDGGTAGVIDYVNTLYGAFPKALLGIALITYLVLMLLFRSLVLPLKAILMNTLSILASYGALVFIFQEGHFSHLLNFTPLGYVEASGPILMFCALFGLSMDYEVFLLSRIRESYDLTHDNTRSVALGLERSGAIITSAAAIVVLVSMAFASADMVIVKALGVGMALAVFLDATLVRGLLVPATMRLLGNANWWWPAPLQRLLPASVYHVAPEHASPPLPADAAGADEPDAALSGRGGER
ncbi:MAG TPA: MMPL family transporter [Ktedonobacterales bacterium]|nr:MMPL family transporter [Ktedonobacterales bacterium]